MSHSNPGRNKRLIHTLLSSLVLLLGVAALIFMIIVEDEFGALPLLLILVGTAWLITARRLLRPH